MIQRIVEKTKEIREKGVNIPGIKKLKGKENLYRFRVGKLIRVIFTIEEGEITIIDADNRDQYR